MFSRFDTIPERHGLTDRRTDGRICYINIARCIYEGKRTEYRKIPNTDNWIPKYQFGFCTSVDCCYILRSLATKIIRITYKEVI